MLLRDTHVARGMQSGDYTLLKNMLLILHIIICSMPLPVILFPQNDLFLNCDTFLRVILFNLQSLQASWLTNFALKSVFLLGFQYFSPADML